MDGHELEDESFDLSGSQFGVMLFPDMPRGIAELARVTRPEGRVVLVVLGQATKIEFFGFFVSAIQTAVPGFTGPRWTLRPCPSSCRTRRRCAMCSPKPD
jgi:ubiquinone/menaquinone biosynthesis C-methylase UbiE